MVIKRKWAYEVTTGVEFRRVLCGACGERHVAAGGAIDVPRVREGGLDVQFWSIYMGKRETAGDAIREALERIDGVHEMAARFPDDVIVAHSVQEIRAAVAEGKFVGLMGIEGGHIIERSLPEIGRAHV